MTTSNTPGSDGDFTYDNSRSYGVETDRWAYPDPAEWAAILASPTNLVSYADDGIDVPYERDELDRVALVGDDGRDADGELMAEYATPHRPDAAAWEDFRSDYRPISRGGWFLDENGEDL